MRNSIKKPNEKKYGIGYAEVNPRKDEIPAYKIIVVGSRKYHKWVFLLCPCGCDDMITLSLMNNYYPHWKLSVDLLRRPSLYPSVWRVEGCKSHFHIRKGKVHWVGRGRK